jgi:hypothetical protein
MALADWLLPLLLLTPEDGHGCELFDWVAIEPVVASPPVAPVIPPV